MFIPDIKKAVRSESVWLVNLEIKTDGFHLVMVIL
jgi:hypothetical protein